MRSRLRHLQRGLSLRLCLLSLGRGLAQGHLAVFATLAIARTAGQRYFLHGLIVGIAWGVLNGLVAVAFFSSYVQHDPKVTQRASSGGLSLRAMFALSAVPIGLLTGLVLGGLCWAASHVIKPAPIGG